MLLWANVYSTTVRGPFCLLLSNKNSPKFAKRCCGAREDTSREMLPEVAAFSSIISGCVCVQIFPLSLVGAVCRICVCFSSPIEEGRGRANSLREREASRLLWGTNTRNWRGKRTDTKREEEEEKVRQSR